MRVCMVCGDEFLQETISGRPARYCSSEHRRRAASDRAMAWYATKVAPNPERMVKRRKANAARARVRRQQPCEIPGCLQLRTKGSRRCDDHCRLMPSGYRLAKGTANGKAGTRLEHRVVMEQVLGRPLRRWEHVHHKNGIKNDNRPENLELWITPQPKGQRPEDLADWVVEFYPDIIRSRLI